ncbi:hypothetical protein [Bradyrhizobium lupini]|uniref:hypothetical protein n=1 Tax=Rhizobium lupini TaxID=136996 RepID=UPI0034C6AE34
MKRLLLGPAILSPLALLGFCSFHTPKLPEVPKVPEVVRQIPLDDFNAFPTPPQITAPTPEPRKAPERKPVVRHRPNQVKPHVRPAPARPSHVVPREAPPAPQALPPQQGPICIFPLNFIPNCTPQEAQ